MGISLELPWITSALEGTGGLYKASPEDFQVEEIPSYMPGGEGPHLYLWVEKRGVPADRAQARISRAFGIKGSQLGAAGNKDTRAVTRQWFSVLDEKQHHTTASAMEVDLGEGMRILSASRHRNRLRTGHLKGNRFDLVLREVGPEALSRAEAIMDALAKHGVPNFYGEQRFGRDGNNVAVGVAMLKGEDHPEARRASRDRFKKRLMVSAVQSWIFNRTLIRRMEEGLLHRVLSGDQMIKAETGGRFEVDDVEAEQRRFDAREIIHTGPIVGHKIGLASGDAGRLEAAALAELEIEASLFKRFGKLALGSRRANLIFPEEVAVEAAGPAAIRVRFALPRGCYATVVLRELIKAAPAHSQARQ